MEFGGSVREGSFEECFVVGSSVEEYSVWGILSLMVLVVVVWSVEGGSVEEYSVGIFCEGKFCRGIFCEGKFCRRIFFRGIFCVRRLYEGRFCRGIFCGGYSITKGIICCGVYSCEILCRGTFWLDEDWITIMFNVIYCISKFDHCLLIIKYYINSYYWIWILILYKLITAFIYNLFLSSTFQLEF